MHVSLFLPRAYAQQSVHCWYAVAIYEYALLQWVLEVMQAWRRRVWYQYLFIVFWQHPQTKIACQGAETNLAQSQSLINQKARGVPVYLLVIACCSELIGWR